MAGSANTIVEHGVDFCVVGGGMAGLTAALAAARHGASVVLMHDRPVPGGNASGECRIPICGADVQGRNPHMRETGILEEIRLDNLRRNPNRSFPVWDALLYEKARFQPNLTLLLNCSCRGADVRDSRIVSVSGWQMTTYTHHVVRAKIFADCSGDGILAPLTGALHRTGREARPEYDEPIAPETADSHTMGLTCLFQAREYSSPQQFTPPAWAERFEHCDELPYGAGCHADWWQMGYWWIELGGDRDSIHETEELRDELLRISIGVWDHLKNRCAYRDRTANWALDWLQFLPAKRESRRYVGDHVLAQGDIEAGGPFADTVAYGGWPMDEHHPSGFNAARLGIPAVMYHPTPSPYGIPYRSLYSRNIDNLMFAGRVASCTHVAMSSARVMGTGCSMGQAVGTAAAIAVRLGLTPREAGAQIDLLQQTLLRDDAYLPGVRMRMSETCVYAIISSSQGDPRPVRDGVNRQVGANRHCWMAEPGDHVLYRLHKTMYVEQATLIFDSALDQNIQMNYHQAGQQLTSIPPTMARAFRVDGHVNGGWVPLHTVRDNHQRLVRLPVQRNVEAVRFTLDETWGAPCAGIYCFDAG
jgi:hypothetical protein